MNDHWDEIETIRGEGESTPKLVIIDLFAVVKFSTFLFPGQFDSFLDFIVLLWYSMKHVLFHIKMLLSFFIL